MSRFLKLSLSILLSLFASTSFVHGEEIDLSLYERSLYSPRGEDGILGKMIQLIAPTARFCVELGAGDGMHESCTPLLRMQGWHCLLLDRAHEDPQLNLHKEFITAENVCQLLKKYCAPEEIDILSVNIGYNNFYIWHAVAEKYRPSIVLVEYNATHLPSVDNVVKYLPYFTGDGTNYYSASILALYHLGQTKGYSLVYAEKTGTTLFFVRNDILSKKSLHFKNSNDVEKIYRYPTYGQGPNGGHRADPKHRVYLSSSDLL